MITDLFYEYVQIGIGNQIRRQQTTDNNQDDNLKDSLKFTLGNVRTLPLLFKPFSNGELFFNKKKKMNTIRKIAFAIFAVFMITASSNPLFSQIKYGHLNYGNLLEQFPERESADKELATYRDQLIKKGETRAKAWQEKVMDFQKKVQSGTMPPVEQQKQQTTLQKEQQDIAAYEQEVIDLISKKRDTLLKPIVDKMNSAIKTVGKENGYTMIFDTSLFNNVLYADESEDVMNLVKKKLGM